MCRLTLCIGSNVEPRRGRVAEAMDWVRSLLVDVRESAIYETPEAYNHGRPYMNAVMSGLYAGDAAAFERLAKKYELAAGRDADARRRGDVHVDIDVVVSDDMVLRPDDFRQFFFKIGADMLSDPLSVYEDRARRY